MPKGKADGGRVETEIWGVAAGRVEGPLGALLLFAQEASAYRSSEVGWVARKGFLGEVRAGIVESENRKGP